MPRHHEGEEEEEEVVVVDDDIVHEAAACSCSSAEAMAARRREKGGAPPSLSADARAPRRMRRASKKLALQKVAEASPRRPSRPMGRESARRHIAAARCDLSPRSSSTTVRLAASRLDGGRATAALNAV